jgi:hypothetical protein
MDPPQLCQITLEVEGATDPPGTCGAHAHEEAWVARTANQLIWALQAPKTVHKGRRFAPIQGLSTQYEP